MIQKIECTNKTDEHGNPAGGSVTGIGLSIEWQSKPLGRGEDRGEPNGTFVETVLDAALQRLRYYQKDKFRCKENAMAITRVEEALLWLHERTRSREEEDVEGTHGVRENKEAGEEKDGR